MSDFEIQDGILKEYNGSGGDVVIPDGVTSIGDSAFEFCSSLTSVVIPDSVTSIGDYAFWGCSSLTSIVIPDSVKSIGESAFRDCSSLTSVVIPDGVTSIGEWAFSDCSSLTSVVIPNSVKSIGESAFRDCSSLTSVVIPDSVTSIGYCAFEDCTRLTDIVIPESVTSIGWSAFSGCKSLTSVVIPDSVTSIDDSAFLCCSSLTSVVIPDSVKSIGYSAFRACSILSSVVIPDSVTSIGEIAFWGCSSLTSVVIPDSVTSIGKEAFSKSLKTVKINTASLAGCKDDTIWKMEIPSITIHDLITVFKKCPKKFKDKAEKRIMESTETEAVAYFEKLNRLDEYAKAHNTDADTLRDSILSDFGLDENGCRTWQLGGKTVTARLEKNLTLTLLDADGKILKAVPKKGAEPEEFDEVKKAFAQLKKDIPAAAKLRNKRLLADWLEARPRTAEAWKNTYLVNPLLKALAKLVVWQQGENTFILNSDGVPVDVNGSAVTLTDEAVILAHPMEMGKELTAAWQEYFTRNQLSQPFAQVWEPVLDGSTITPDRYVGATIPQYMLMNKEVHGITMEGQSKLRLRDCSAELKYIQGHTDWVNNEYEIKNFRFVNFTRAVNHIAAHFDKGTVEGRLLKDDTSAVEWLDYFTLAQISEMTEKVIAKGDCPNASAALMEYKQNKYPNADPFEEFTLDW